MKLGIVLMWRVSTMKLLRLLYWSDHFETPLLDIRRCILQIRRLEDLFSQLDSNSQRSAIHSLYSTPSIDRKFKISEFSKNASTSLNLQNDLPDFEVAASYQYLSRLPKSKPLVNADSLVLFEDKQMDSELKEKVLEAIVYQMLFNSSLRGLILRLFLKKYF